MAVDGAVGDVAFLLGRAIYAGVLGFLAVGNLLDDEATVGYAESKGVPAAGVAVPLGSLLLIGGAVSILLGAFPLVGALAVVAFLLPVTPTMHDFWNAEGTDRQNEQIHFLKNAGLLGTALLFVALAGSAWPYALGPTLF